MLEFGTSEKIMIIRVGGYMSELVNVINVFHDVFIHGDQHSPKCRDFIESL